MGAHRYSDQLSLEGFVRYMLGLDLANLRPVAFYDFGNVLSLVLYRDPPWQAELFILRPGPGFPRLHRHPDVDAYEYDLDGSTPFIVNGIPAKDAALGLKKRPLYRVLSTDWHGVGDVPEGSSFLSIQEWKNGRAPTSVGLNWEGTPVSDKHHALLRSPNFLWKKTIMKALRA